MHPHPKTWTPSLSFAPLGRDERRRALSEVRRGQTTARLSGGVRHGSLELGGLFSMQHDQRHKDYR